MIKYLVNSLINKIKGNRCPFCKSRIKEPYHFRYYSCPKGHYCYNKLSGKIICTKNYVIDYREGDKSKIYNAPNHLFYDALYAKVHMINTPSKFSNYFSFKLDINNCSLEQLDDKIKMLALFV